MDRLITELQLSPLEAYHHIDRILQQVSAVLHAHGKHNPLPLFMLHVPGLDSTPPNSTRPDSTRRSTSS